MSQSQNPKDSQALLQSMLQRLKLQSGKEGQEYLHTPVPITAASTWGQDGERGASDFQNVKNSPVNDFKFGINGTPSKELAISAVDSDVGLKSGEIQEPGHGSKVEGGLVSFSSQKDNIDDDTDENRVVEQAIQPGITPTGTGQLFPTKPLQDADITSFERLDGESVSFGSSAMTKHISPNTNTVSSIGQNQDQGFTPKVYMWSMKSADPGGQENNGLHVRNGGYGALAQSTDVQIVSSSKNTTNSSLRRKQRSSENKPRRWTQKIRERWKDRRGSFSKKGQEEGATVDQRSEQGTEISLPNQMLITENLINASNNDGEKTFPSPDSSPSKTLPAHTEDGASDGHIRSTSDFEFGLGSFSLLEEIVKGQEWAKFLNSNLSATSANQRPSEEPPNIQPNPHDSNQASGILNRLGGGSQQWSIRSTDLSPATDFSLAQISPEASTPVSMDVSEGKQQPNREVDQSEPMEDGHNQSDMQSGQSGLGEQLRPSFAEPADNPLNSALKSRILLNRKRQHQPANRRDERLQTEKISEEAAREGSESSLSPASSHVMDETWESQHDKVIPLVNSHPTPLSPSYFNPHAPVPRGVLKHSISQDSESSMETLTKRRRVEEKRRVHFSEEVFIIPSPALDLDATDSEDDSEAEEDSLLDQECDVEQAAAEEVAPVRRAVLPAWILALKKRKTGRKQR